MTDKPDIPETVLERCAEAGWDADRKEQRSQGFIPCWKDIVKRYGDKGQLVRGHRAGTKATLLEAHYPDLVAALRFYANKQSWKMREARYDYDRTYVTPSETDLDDGDKARAALEKAGVTI